MTLTREQAAHLTKWDKAVEETENILRDARNKLDGIAREMSGVDMDDYGTKEMMQHRDAIQKIMAAIELTRFGVMLPEDGEWPDEEEPAEVSA